MNVLLLTTHLNTGGIAVYIKTLSQALKRQGHRVFVISSGGHMVQDIETLGVVHKTIDIRTKSEISLKIYRALPQIAGFIEENNIQVIHAQTRVTQVMSALLSWKTKRPYVSTCHGFFKRRMARRLFPCWGEAVIAISQAVKNHLIEDFHIPSEDIVLIPNGLDIQDFPLIGPREKEERRRGLGLKNVLTVGIIARLSDIKGHCFLIEAMNKVIRRFASTQLLIIGEGKEEQKLKDQVKKFHLENHVYFLPIVNRTAEVLSAIDIFVMPSLQEGLGLSVMEAQAMGLAVVASRVGGLVNLIKNGETGLLVEPQDVEGLSRAIVYLLENETEAKRMGIKAREFVLRTCSSEEMAQRTGALYQRLLEKKEPKNILVINVNWRGDVIFSSPVFKALKARFSHARVSCLAVGRVKDILKSTPHLDEIIEFDEKGRHWTPWGKWQLIQQLKKKRFDAVFILHRSFVRALITFLSGIPIRVGYATKNRGFLLTHKVRSPNRDIHRSDYYLRVLESFGVKIEDRVCELTVDDSVECTIEEILTRRGIGPGDFFVLLNAGGNWNLKRWPAERFSLLADRLEEEFGAKVVFPGSSGDIDLVRKICDLSDSNPVNLSGQTTLIQLMVLMRRADLLISADSGPLHMANALGTDVIGIFGPTDPKITGPRGKGRVVILKKDVVCNQTPCYKLDCSDNICMRAVEIEDVLDAVRKLKG